MSQHYPRISVITPSFNQAQFLERTMCSVLDQGYPNLEYIVIDGGSTDGSVEIIQKYADRLAYWVSESDRGQAHAINKGLERATGDWVGWQNSDDIFYPDAFMQVVQAAIRYPQAELIIGDMNLIDELDKVIRELIYVRPTYESLLAEGMVLSNQAAFWRRSLHARIGWLNESLHYGFDYEWFLRVLRETEHAVHVQECLGALRYHDATKTSRSQTLFDEEYRGILAGRGQPGWKKNLYRARRMLLTLADGHFSYVLRGIKRRGAGLGK
ncbi:MAG: glycosyl transferase [Hydrogenophilales bacterium RIFOXYD1_FULL_62_11]|nr:MAG: glycosyl transferase [Hydrogenophilales bacterium RIFOXYD1_FULL_62_11]